MTQDALFDLDLDPAPPWTPPAVPSCALCDRPSNLEVCAFSWDHNTYRTHRWLRSCWWHTGDVTDLLRDELLTIHPAYLIRWTAKPYGIVAGGTRAYADVEKATA